MDAHREVIIRRMTIEELDDIQKLYAEQVASDGDPLAKLRVNPKQHAWEMRRIRQQWLASQKYLPYVAVAHPTEDTPDQPPQLIGYAAAIIEHQAHLFEVETVANLGELWVTPSWRGKGIGTELVAEVLHAIDALGISWISLHIPCDDPLKAFFQKRFGFRQSAIEMHLCLDDIPSEHQTA